MSSEEIKLSRLRAAFENQRCVSAWLGHGDALFLGFGNEVMPRPLSGSHARPPYELETNYASWRVEREIHAEWSDSESGSDRAQLTAAAESLVGETVVDWQFVDGATLRLVFTGEKVLVVEPWQTDDGISDAWSLSAPDGKVFAVSNDSRIVVVESDLPIRDWFT
jgi:hypothetical protein